MRKTLITLTILFVGAVSQASLVEVAMTAKMTNIDSDFKQCLETNMTQLGMQGCADAANSDYRSALADMSTEMVSSFSDDENAAAKLAKMAVSEQNWANYVTSTCEFANMDSVGGSIHNLDMVMCENKKIAARIKELISIYNNFLNQ